MTRSTSALNRLLNKSINFEFVRFVFFGAINTISTYILYALLLQVTPYSVAYSLSYFAGIVLSYLLNSFFVFHQPFDWKKALSFPLVYLVQYLLGVLLLYVLISLMGVHQLIAPGLVIVLTLPVTFVLSRLVIRGNAMTAQVWPRLKRFSSRDYVPLLPLVVLAAQNLMIFKDHYFGDVGFPWDFPMGYYGLVAFWTSAVRNGIFPEWVPFQQMGYPFAMMLQSGRFYPPLWFFPLFHISYTLNAATIMQCLHVLMGSIGMYLVVRTWVPSVGLAFLGAFVFQLFGGFYSNSEHADIIRAFALAPWLLYVFSLNTQGGTSRVLSRRNLFIPLVFYLLATGGYPGNFLSSTFSMAVFVLLQLVETYRQDRSIARLTALAVSVGGLTLVGIAMATVHLGPTWQEKDQLIRFGGFENLGRFSLWIDQVPALFLSNKTVPGEVSMTSTFITLPMVILASFVTWNDLKKYWVQVAFCLFAILMVSGEGSPFWVLVTTVIPPLKFSRFPASDYRVFVAIPLILLAILGLKSITLKELSRRGLVLRTLLVLAWFLPSLYAAYGVKWTPSQIIALFIAAASLGLIYFAWNRGLGLSKAVLVSLVLLLSLDAWRVLPDIDFWREPGISHFYEKRGWPYLVRGDLVTNTIFGQLPSERPSRTVAPTNQFSWGGYIDGRYLVNDLGPGLLRLVPAVTSDKLYADYMQMEWLPLFLDPGLIQAGSRNLVLSDGDLAGYLEISGNMPKRLLEQSYYGIDDISYHVSLPEPRIMVENETFFPGWTARLIYPDREYQIQAIAVNDVFRAWVLPAGDYEMKAHFEFPNTWIFRGVSVAALITWIGILVRYWLTRNVSQPHATGALLLQQ